MKKIFTLLSIALLSTTSLFAQSPVTIGNVIIDPYVGIPNWANSIMFSKYDASNTDGTQENVRNYAVNGSMLSYGGRFEYLLAENFGLGADVNYEVSGFNFDYDDVDTVTLQVTNFHYDYTAKKIRVMARFNYHFVQNDRLDVYAGFAGGYKHINRTGYQENISTGNRNEVGGSSALIPVTLRVAIGTRVYFTENIGAMVELGAFGGGLLQFGLSAKF